MSAAGEIAAFFVVLIIGGTMLAVWYAYHREDSGDFEYLLSYWLGGLPGMFAYREYRAGNPEVPESVRLCPDCGGSHADRPNFCDECGTDLGEADEHPAVAAEHVGKIVFCGNCDAEQGTGGRRCERCGYALV